MKTPLNPSSARILKEEHRIYSEAVCLLVEDKVRLVGRRLLRKD